MGSMGYSPGPRTQRTPGRGAPHFLLALLRKVEKKINEKKNRKKYMPKRKHAEINRRRKQQDKRLNE